MYRLVIAGGGFAGVSALRALARAPKSLRDKIEILLIDKKPYFEFLPMLPDISGGWLGPDRLRRSLDELAGSVGAGFVRERIDNLDLNNKIVKTAGQDIAYDQLIIATGSETNFYGNDFLRKRCSYIDNVEDAISVRKKILDKARKGSINIVVIGGGYTGIELASNLDILLRKNGLAHTVYIAERAKEVLMMLPGWMRDEVKKDLNLLQFVTLLLKYLNEYDVNTLLLESGKKIQDAVCIWTAGVKTPEFIDDLDVPKEKSRIVVDKYLRPLGFEEKGVFAAGDSAYFDSAGDGRPLRMAVMFSMGQGKIAARNILNSLGCKPLREYSPVDLGYLIPVANGNAPGMVLGVNIHGLLGYIMHYFMCIYRSETGKRTGILKDLFLKMINKKGGGR